MVTMHVPVPSPVIAGRQGWNTRETHGYSFCHRTAAPWLASNTTGDSAYRPAQTANSRPFPLLGKNPAHPGGAMFE